MKISDLMWWFKWRFVPRHRYNVIHTGLPPGYYDADWRMLHGMMALLSDYVEHENGGEAELARWTEELRARKDEYTPQGQIHIQEEALAIYHWWKHERQPQWDALDESYSELYGGYDLEFEPPDADGNQLMKPIRTNPNASHTSEQLWDLEASLEAKDQEMLHRLVNIRRSLWT